MRILLHDEAPGIGGSKVSCLEAVLALSRRGHQVKISASRNDSILFKNVVANFDPDVRACYDWADISIVHFPSHKKAMEHSARSGKPIVNFICNVDSPRVIGIDGASSLVVFNSRWLMEDTKYSGNKMVLYPPVYPERFATQPGTGILLVSPFRCKGIYLFLEAAGHFHDRGFIIARGATWGQEELGQIPLNVRIVERCSDVRHIYSLARLVLMPSVSERKGDWVWEEGYGRVAIEAAASGIPTIASRESRGLRECLGEGGLFAGSTYPEEWFELIQRLDSKVFYDQASKYALKLSAERHPDKQIDELEARLEDICSRK